MRLAADDPGPVASELDVCAALVPLDGAAVLDVGCGRAEFTRAAAARYPSARFLALEVDAVQHARNLASTAPPNLAFAAGGADAIPAPDASVDVVLMLKSLHHVPVPRMDVVLREVARVLRPGGRAYVSEPVPAGPFHALTLLFHDERAERTAAFEALRRAVAAGGLALDAERFWQASRRFADFDDFDARMIRVTHSERRVDGATLDAVRRRYAACADADGSATFAQPMRTDVLRRPA